RLLPLSLRFSQVLTYQQSSVLLFLIALVALVAVMPPATAGEGELGAGAMLRGDRHGSFAMAEELDGQILGVTGVCHVPAATQHHRGLRRDALVVLPPPRVRALITHVLTVAVLLLITSPIQVHVRIGDGKGRAATVLRLAGDDQ